MADAKISDLTELITATPDDILVVVDTNAIPITTKKIGVDNLVKNHANVASNTAHALLETNPHNVTKTQIGLGSVDNTSDVNKPVSTATQTAIDLIKARATHTGTQLASTISDFDTTVKSNTAVSSYLLKSIASKAVDYTLQTNDHTILVDATTGVKTITLTDVATHVGRIFNIKKIDTSVNEVIIDDINNDVIDNQVSITISKTNTSLSLQSDGSKWWII